MPEHSSKYVRMRDLAAIALLSHPSIEAAAKSIGISEKAMRLWLEKPDLQSRLRAVKQQVMDGSVARLTGLTGKAVETLERCLSSKKDGEAVKAARGILEFVSRLDRSQLQERVEALERQIVEMQRGRTVTVDGRIVHECIGVTVDRKAFFDFLDDVRGAFPAKPDQGEVIDNAEPLPNGLKELPYQPTGDNADA